MDWWFLIIVPIAFVLIAFVIFIIFRIIAANNRKQQEQREAVEKWLNNPDGIVYEQWQLIARKYGTVGEFKLKYQQLKGKLKEADYSAIYVLKNLTNDFYYVGQSVNVFKRVNQHFSGKGNGNVYADYKYGQDFQVNIIPVEKDRLNEIEFNLIKILNANGAKGYNISKGIKSTNFKF